jgi:hypothetical protein
MCSVKCFKCRLQEHIGHLIMVSFCLNIVVANSNKLGLIICSGGDDFKEE